MGLLAVIALACWIAGTSLIAPVTVSLVVITLMILTGVVTWNDIVGNTQGWNVLVWFATLLALADGLRQVGFLTWVAERSAAGLVGLPVGITAVAVVAIFFFLHYLFASTSAHTTAVLPAFLAIVVAVPNLPTTAVVYTLVY